ncbi:putative glucan endo-1,3-beta-glucosidase btgC [Ceratocystis lukuohia]|uniref:glucan endo-1,3-beta-D-glucosidase n=1 Tax=Ceratocystis lukuohia TaxID=2019550 RepID=A0ABR4M929_9PEZI
MPLDSFPPSLPPEDSPALPLPTPSPPSSPSASSELSEPPSPSLPDSVSNCYTTNPNSLYSQRTQLQQPQPQHRSVNNLRNSSKPTITHVISSHDLHTIASPTRLVRHSDRNQQSTRPPSHLTIPERAHPHPLTGIQSKYADFDQEPYFCSPSPALSAEYHRQIDPDLRTASTSPASLDAEQPSETSPFDNSYAILERIPSSSTWSGNQSRLQEHHHPFEPPDNVTSLSLSGRSSPFGRRLSPTSDSGRAYQSQSIRSSTGSSTTSYITASNQNIQMPANGLMSGAPASASVSNRNSQISSSNTPTYDNSSSHSSPNPDYSVRTTSGQPPSPVLGPEVPLHRDFDVNTPLPVIRSLGSSSRSPSRSASSLRDPFQDDHFQNYASSRGLDPRLGEVNPQMIADDGDDGLVYGKSGRNSLINVHRKSASSVSPNIKAAAAMGGAVMLNTLPGGSSPNQSGTGLAADAPTPHDSTYKVGAAAAAVGFSPDGLAEKGHSALSIKNSNKRRKLCIIITLGVLLLAAIIGGTLGGYLGNRNKKGSSSDSDNGQSASQDTETNGVLTKDSAEIKKLLNNANLHKVFPGMDYTPLNTQYPDCLHNPPSQNNITRDIAVLSQLTNVIRLYGTDCNQTEMVLEAMKNLDVSSSMSLWMGVWQDSNTTTNSRQLSQMWDVLDNYGTTPFRGLVVANEILFREEMTETELGNLMAEVRTNLTDRGFDALPVCTSDLGDKWTSSLADKSDVIMSNIHPFFGGVPYAEAANWTWSFFNNKNADFFKADAADNIISEIGWPTSGGTNCPADVTDCGSTGSIASVDGLNALLDDWVCAAMENGTNYFWFSAFDEPWKVRFNEEGAEWEDQWGLMDVNRNLKEGVVIPDCGGKTVS